MKITEDEAIQTGMQQKAEKFKEAGAGGLHLVGTTVAQ
jgi:hypothetical protein